MKRWSLPDVAQGDGRDGGYDWGHGASKIPWNCPHAEEFARSGGDLSSMVVNASEVASTVNELVQNLIGDISRHAMRTIGEWTVANEGL